MLWKYEINKKAYRIKESGLEINSAQSFHYMGYTGTSEIEV